MYTLTNQYHINNTPILFCIRKNEPQFLILTQQRFKIWLMPKPPLDKDVPV